ncbi:hypothetical protein BDF14DRAFT_1839831 [Spinellus fusiger]|nr:hypothetical protein BDF14DRAFT_1839831 [Spinellus fusiger]
MTSSLPTKRSFYGCRSGSHTIEAVPDSDSDSDDVWEKAAHATRTTHYGSSSIYAQQAAVLEIQYKALVHTEETLTSTLHKAQLTLDQLDRELEEECVKIDKLSTQYDEAVHSNVVLAEQVLEVSTQSESGLFSFKNDTVAWKEYLAADSALSDTLEKAINTWEKHCPKTLPKNPGADIEVAVEAHSTLEWLWCEAEATCKGYEAKLRTMEREIQKLNSLPQFLPGLRSTLAMCQQETKQCRALLVDTKKVTLQPLLESYSHTSIRASLSNLLVRQEHQAAEKQLLALERIFQSLVQQRACQQLLTYRYCMEIEQQEKHHALYQALEEELMGEHVEHRRSMVNNEEELKSGPWVDTQWAACLYATLVGLAPDASPETPLDTAALVENTKELLQKRKEWQDQWYHHVQTHTHTLNTLEEMEERFTDTLFRNTENKEEEAVTMPKVRSTPLGALF